MITNTYTVTHTHTLTCQVHNTAGLFLLRPVIPFIHTRPYIHRALEYIIINKLVYIHLKNLCMYNSLTTEDQSHDLTFINKQSMHAELRNISNCLKILKIS